MSFLFLILAISGRDQIIDAIMFYSLIKVLVSLVMAVVLVSSLDLVSNKKMLKVRNNFGWIAYIILSLLPVVFWYFLKPINERFSNLTMTLTSLGQITGLVGMAMFSLTLVLSSRLKFLENYFGGLNRIYTAHHIFGSIAFILLLFHPLILAGKFIQVSLRSAALFLLPSGNWPINFGIIALFLMMLLLTLTFFVKLPYQIWKFSHKFLVAAFLFVVLHSFFIPSDISRDPILKIYMLALAGVGIIAFIYRYTK